MKLLFNGQLLYEEELKLPVTNRAFQYNDGFFETIMVINGKLRFWQDHLERIQTAAKTLCLDLPAIFSKPSFENRLLELAACNNALSYGRLKLKVWRSGAGIYTPEINGADWLVTVQASAEPKSVLQKVGVCAGVRTSYSPLSVFKGPNALLYVLAGKERKERGFDDLVMLNSQSLISELTTSNIFWCQDEVVYTPSLETGCINGIMRRNILRWCGEAGIKTREAFFDVDNLLQTQSVFSANVTGIKAIKELIGFELQVENDIILMLQQKVREV